ncbi:MAG: hypothetical protein IAF94_13755 [Pirellulaceae bacterium]|nr:hypothetical protein [Pirellulaceae bacterium]
MSEPSINPKNDLADQFRLRPPDCPSREEKLHEFEPLPQLPAIPIPTAAPFQFTVFDLMIVMIGVAGGLAGGTWMPSDIFAALLGLVTLLGLALVHFFPPESHFARLMWGTLVLAYVVAVGAAIFKGN